MTGSFSAQFWDLSTKVRSELESKLAPAGSGDETVQKFITLVRIIEEFPGGSVSMISPDCRRAFSAWSQ